MHLCHDTRGDTAEGEEKNKQTQLRAKNMVSEANDSVPAFIAPGRNRKLELWVAGEKTTFSKLIYRPPVVLS